MVPHFGWVTTQTSSGRTWIPFLLRQGEHFKTSFVAVCKFQDINLDISYSLTVICKTWCDSHHFWLRPVQLETGLADFPYFFIFFSWVGHSINIISIKNFPWKRTWRGLCTSPAPRNISSRWHHPQARSGPKWTGSCQTFSLKFFTQCELSLCWGLILKEQL